MTLAAPDKKDFSTIIVNNSGKTLSYKTGKGNKIIAEIDGEVVERGII